MGAARDQTDQINFNRDKEKAQKRKDKVYRMASRPLSAMMGESLFLLMVLGSAAYGIGDYLGRVQDMNNGYISSVPLKLPIESAFFLWTIIGVFVIGCGITIIRKHQIWIAENREKALASGTIQDSSVPPELRKKDPKEEERRKLKEELFEREREIKKFRIMLIVTIAGIVLLGMLWLIL